MNPLPIVPLALIAAGLLDLIFALGLHLFGVWAQRRTDLPPQFRPKRFVVIILVALGILTTLAGVLLWVLTP